MDSQISIPGLEPTVTLYEYSYRRFGHGAASKEIDYTVYLNNVRLRGFSTHGNMQEGYWGASAKHHALEYANRIAATLGVELLRPGTPPPAA